MNYYVERVLQAFITYFAAITLAFVLYRLMPGGPVEALRQQIIDEQGQTGQALDMEQINRLTQIYTKIDPEAPVHIAYAQYMEQVIVYQDFGRSIIYSRPVFDVLFEAMPWSIFVSVYGLLLGFSLNILLGSLMAYKEGGKFDQGSTVFVIMMGSIPYYVGAIAMLGILSFQWGIFPTGGRMDHATTPGFNIPFMAGILYHGALPIMTGFIVGFGGGSLAMRANAVRILGSDYMHAARVRGVSSTRMTTRYIARNAILPVYTGLMIGIAGIFSSSVIMEQIFSYPGVGWYTFEALVLRDYPLLMGAFLFFTGITVLGILIADLTYGLIDPRAGTGGERESF